MKWRREVLAAAAAAGLAGGIAARGELASYIQNLDRSSRLQRVFFDAVALPSGPVLSRRPPSQTRPALNAVVAAAPGDAELYALRAREAELALDFAAAEADWRKHAELSFDRGAGLLALADYYALRLQPKEQLQVLMQVGRLPSPPGEKFTTPSQQRAWGAWESALEVIEAQALPVEQAMACYREWIARYPAEPLLYEKFLGFLLAKKQYGAVEELIAARQKVFPEDVVFAVRARAGVERSRGAAQQALAVYEKSFQPLWPGELVQGYFELLKETRALRRFLERTRAALAANPEDLNAAARLYYYHRQQNNMAGAERALIDFRLRKEARKSGWRGEELLTLARLAEAAGAHQEAARHYYALYSLPGGGDGDREKALCGLALLLMDAPEQPMRLGAGDLSFYKDIATLDPYPGFLNGILSLILNSSYPGDRYANQERASAAYFHRARAAELIALADQRFPGSRYRARLHSRLIEVYATYGAGDELIRAGQRFLAAFPNAPERTEVSLQMADAHARKEQTQQEFAVYEALLKELAARAEGVPLGAGATLPQAPRPEGAEQEEPGEPRRYGRRQAPRIVARSVEYARVLDRYIARLVSLKRVKDALALYRRELDRNPNDPGLYERLAAFLDQNKLGAEVEQVYRRAMGQFADRSWHHKLARWYLRRKQAAQFEALTREVVKIFSGTELETYLAQALQQGPLDAVLYRQVNLYANERFPHNLSFVRNLLHAYRQRATADPAAWERLLRNYWPYDDNLRARFFEFLSRSGRLQTELQTAQALSQGATLLRLAAEGEAWQAHFEAAAPHFRKLAAEFPGDHGLGRRAAAVARSLGDASGATAVEENLHRHAPRSIPTLERLGEIQADREVYDRARTYWNRIMEIEPGKEEGYLAGATVFWDYYQFDDALRVIGEGRKRLGKPDLFAYQAGAIYENRREYGRAIDEYARGALQADEPSQARGRLIELARRGAHQAAIESLTAKLAGGAEPPQNAIGLRVALLEAQGRREELERLLAGLAEKAPTLDRVLYLRGIASRQGMDRVEERLLNRELALLTDPVDRIRTRLAQIRFYEGRQDLKSAGRLVEGLYREHPAVLGVVRATVDYYWRTKDTGRALETLSRAAKAAYPELARRFTFEGARKATEAGRPREARAMLAGLLGSEPGRPEYLAAMADTYAREGDDRGLRAFYLEKIGTLKDPVQVAALRRGLIPVLTRTKDYVAAIDQYIELINRYPEDESLVGEAAGYASRHGRRDQLRGYYGKTAAQSPKDYRWPLVQARLEAHFEDFPAAIAAYTRAAAIRPDRADLVSARASMEERLLRFQEAERSYQRLYELSYRNPVWMEKVAEVQARQGRTGDALKSLRLGLIEGRPPRAEAFFQAAERLERWEMLKEARQHAEQGMDLAQDAGHPGGAVYARVLTRLRDYQTAFQRAPRPEIGAMVRIYYTPQEKDAFVAFLDKQRGPEAERVLPPIAEAAGLWDAEARWRREWALAAPGSPQARAHVDRVAALEASRMRHDELGAFLEAYWKVHPRNESRDAFLEMAARSYRWSGNHAAELRALAALGTPGGPLLDRLHGLLLQYQPRQLLARAGRDYEAASYAIEHGSRDLALQAVAARGKTLPPVWTRAYTALAGLYQGRQAPEVESAFRAALGTGTIGERLGKTVDRKQQMAGNTWFYYASRYGEYLGLGGQAEAEDYLPAPLEAAPASANAYFELGEYYAGKGDAARAVPEFEYTLQIDPDRGAAHARVAAILWEQGRKEESAARWKAAIEAFARQQNHRRVPPAFWEDVRGALAEVGKRGLLAGVRREADLLLRTYIRRNGTYRFEPLARGVLAAAGDPAAGVSWLADLSRAAGDPVMFMGWLSNQSFIPEAGRETLLRRLLEEAQAKAGQAVGDMREYAQSQLEDYRYRWATYLVDTRQTEKARAAVDALRQAERPGMERAYALLDLRIAAQAGRLEALLERYRREREKSPPLEILRDAANILRRAGDAASVRRILEHVYTREIEEMEPSPVSFLGLAEIRLEENRTGEAVSLLRRMNLVAAEAFVNLEAAASLLERKGHGQEAREFREAFRKAVPWEEARRKLVPQAPRRELAKAAIPDLLGVLSSEPDALDARLALFRAAHQGGRHGLAISAMQPLIERGGLRWMLERPAEEEGEHEAGTYRYQAEQFLAGMEMSDAERAQYTLQLAESYAADGRLAAAITLCGVAAEMQPSGPARARLEALRAEKERRARNVERRPKVGADLEQPKVVRPRLQAAGAGGGR